MSGPRKWACPRCHSTSVQYIAWVDANSGDVVDGEPPRDANWCTGCESEVPYLKLLTPSELERKAKP